MTAAPLQKSIDPKTGETPDNVSIETLSFAAKDGWMLTGDVIQGPSPTIGILISAGTGFPRRYYHRVARFFAEQGAAVLVYDYRGIGDSGNQDLASSRIEYADWGVLDMAAALDHLQQMVPDKPLTHLAHSVGGQFAGLMHNHHKLTRQAFVAVGVGYWGMHHLNRMPLELLFWWGIGPMMLARYGFINNVGPWSGEPLPPNVFKTWRRWSQSRHYNDKDLATTLKPHNHFAAITSPIRSWIFPDDGIATPKAAAKTLSLYSGTEISVVNVEPSEIGVKSIGHEGAMRPGRAALWQQWWQWLSQAEQD